MNAKPKEVQHDETPSIIADHAFEPKGKWWSLCAQCNLAESAHKYTNRINYEADKPV